MGRAQTMIVGKCFDGDDLGMALAQHDLYFGRALLEEHLLNGRTTIGYLWIECIWGCLICAHGPA